MTDPYRRRGSNRSVTVYHNDSDCPIGKQIDNTAPVDPNRDLELCEWCAGKVDTTGPQRTSLRAKLEATDA